MDIGIIGGGINGLCCAWQLAKQGHQVQLYERDTLMNATSRASTKLLHGGLRYLENGEFRLVREALSERRSWFTDAPQHARPLKLTLPIYRTARRPSWLVGVGLGLYDLLATGSGLPRHTWQSRENTIGKNSHLKTDGLLGSFTFWDGQMDDLQLGLWVIHQAQNAGVQVSENTTIKAVSPSGQVTFADSDSMQFDQIVNAAGPWASQLLAASKINSQHSLDLVRGSHIVLNRPCPNACLLEVPNERRIFFVLPWQGQTLVGTTEERQPAPAPGTTVAPSAQEIAYLLNAYNSFFTTFATSADITTTFAGLRPLVKSASSPSRATREYAFERHGKLITIFGGKWTTARALARHITKLIPTP